MSTYANMFRKIYIKNNGELKDPYVLMKYKTEGFNWIIRPDFKGLSHFLRDPTIGFPVELHTWNFPGSVHVDSSSGKKLCNSMCFF